MTDEELADYIAEKDMPAAAAAYLRGKFAHCPRFRDFASANRDKIREKFRKFRKTKDEEDIEDVAAELKVAYLLLLDDRFSLTYEKYKSDKSHRGPDITASFCGQVGFNVEVKRIRESPKFEGRLNKWHSEACDRIRRTPSSLWFSLEVTTMDGNVAIMDRLEPAADEIVAFCVQTIKANDSSLPLEIPCNFRVPDFDDLLRLTLFRSSNRGPSDSTGLSGHCAPVLSSGKECEKFGSLTLDKLTQFMPSIPNVLLFKVSSLALAYQEMQMGLDSLGEIFRKRNDVFLLERTGKDSAQLLPHWQGLTAVVYLEHGVLSARTPNFLWANPDASHRLPVEVSRYLEEMR